MVCRIGPHIAGRVKALKCPRPVQRPAADRRPAHSTAMRRALSTHFHRRMAHLRPCGFSQVHRDARAHHKDRARRAQGRARPPRGSLFAANGGRRRRLTMSPHRQRDASTPEAAKRRSSVAPSYESKYGTTAQNKSRSNDSIWPDNALGYASIF